MHRTITNLPSQAAPPTSVQHRDAQSLRQIVAQFHLDIDRILTQSKQLEESNEELCHLFNLLVDRAIEIYHEPTPQSRKDLQWLRQLRLPNRYGPFTQPVPTSVLFSRTGSLKAFLESKIAIAPAASAESLWSLLMLSGGVVMACWMVVWLFRAIMY